MRIGIDITPVIYEHTGVGVYTRELVSHLLKLYPQDKFVLFASTLRGQKKLWQYLKTLSLFTNWNAKIYPFPPLLTETLWNRLHRLPVEKLVGPVEVFHAWDWQQPPAQTAKVITTIHDLTVLKFPQHQHPRSVAVHRRRLHWVSQEAAAVIADSQSTKQDIIELLGVPPARIHVVYLAASSNYAEFRNQNLEIRNKEIDRVRQKYNLPPEFILASNINDPRKNAKIVNQASTLPVFNLNGPIPASDLPALYAAARVFVFPSLYEGFGLPVLEAMSVGTPVVTSDRGSLAEIAGNAAIMVDPESVASVSAGINEALKRKAELIKKGFAQAQKFSWETTTQQTLKIYKSLVARP